jgi:hypothetical protein
MSSMPQTGTRAWYAVLAAHDIADSLRRLRLPCAARLSLPTATPQDWDDIGTELAALAVDDVREHERRAVRDAVRHMARGEPVGAATVLSRLRGVATLTEWADEVVAAMRDARIEAFIAATGGV